MVWSKFLLSVSMWAVVIISLFQSKKFSDTEKKPLHTWVLEYLQLWNWRWATPQYNSIFGEVMPFFKQYCSNWWQNKAFFAASVPFLLMLAGGFWTSDGGYLFHTLKMYLPFLILPMAFANLPPLSKKQFLGVLYFYFLTMSIACFVVLLNYGLHFQAATKLLGEGQPMPLMREHVTFGCMTAFSVFIGLELWSQKFVWQYNFERILIPALTIFLFVALHVLSIRGGLFVMYICLIFKCLEFIFRKKKYILGVASLSLLAIIPLLSYRFVPSFRNKMNYSIWDLGKFREGTGGSYSDSERIVSIQIGWNIFKKHGLTGVGSGDVWSEIQAVYAQSGQFETAKMPHNQFLIIGIGTGIVGILIFLAAFLTPLFYKRRYKNSLFAIFHVIVFAYFWFEMPFEAAFSVAFYTFGVSLFLNFSLTENTEFR